MTLMAVVVFAAEDSVRKFGDDGNATGRRHFLQLAALGVDGNVGAVF